MSIIHDALKMAEYERQSIPLRRPVHRSAQPSSGRWPLWATVSFLIGATILGGAGGWIWFASPDPFSTDGIAESIASHSPSAAPEPAQRTSTGPVARDATPIPVGPWDRSSAEGGSVPTMADDANAQAALTRARSAEASDQIEMAIALYRQSIASYPQPAQVYNHLGKLLVHQGEIDDAIAQFQAALAIDADYVLARNNLGSAYLLRGAEGLAVQEFLAALRIDNAYVSPYYNLALLYARRRDSESALAFLTKALLLDPNVWSWVRDEPGFDRIRRTPEFRRLWSQRQASR